MCPFCFLYPMCHLPLAFSADTLEPFTLIPRLPFYPCTLIPCAFTLCTQKMYECTLCTVAPFTRCRINWCPCTLYPDSQFYPLPMDPYTLCPSLFRTLARVCPLYHCTLYPLPVQLMPLYPFFYLATLFHPSPVYTYTFHHLPLVPLHHCTHVPFVPLYPFTRCSMK